jgi:hypothetical protein
MKCEKSRTSTGITVMMNEALIGVDKFNPSKNSNWLTATPKKAHKANLNKSLFSTFSDGMNR